MFHSSLSFDDDEGRQKDWGLKVGPESVEIIIAGSVMVVVKQVSVVCAQWATADCCCVLFCLVQSLTVTCAVRSCDTRCRCLRWTGFETKSRWLVIRNPFSSFLKSGRQIVWASSVGRLTDYLLIMISETCIFITCHWRNIFSFQISIQTWQWPGGDQGETQSWNWPRDLTITLQSWWNDWISITNSFIIKPVHFITDWQVSKWSVQVNGLKQFLLRVES